MKVSQGKLGQRVKAAWFVDEMIRFVKMMNVLWTKKAELLEPNPASTAAFRN